MQLKGKVKVIFDTQTFSSGFTKKEFVLTVPDGQFPQDIKFEVLKDKTALLNKVDVGDELEVDFDIRGREHNGNYYINLVAWRISNLGGSTTQDSGMKPNDSFQGSSTVEDYRDLPF